MPFTLAHPAVVLFTPKSEPIAKYLHKPALIIGSMSPDFIYFLTGVPSNKVGHTIIGCFSINLPLCFVIYYLYKYFVYPYFWQNLPKLLSLQPQFYPKPHSSIKSSLIFTASSFIGMATHIGLDLFTHKGSTIVKNSDLLQMTVGVETVAQLPLYKWFQYGGGILGLSIIGLYVVIMAQRHPSNYPVPIFDKLKYWASVSQIVLFSLIIWHFIDPIIASGNSFVVLLIIRLVDVGFVGLVFTGLFQKVFGKNSMVT